MPNFLRSTLAILIAFGLLCVPFLVIRVGYSIDLIGAKTQIEQLRSDMQNISDVLLSSVVGQATKWNQTIRSRQAYNNTWWGDPLIPDDWDTIAMLPLPSQDVSPVGPAMQEDLVIQDMSVGNFDASHDPAPRRAEIVAPNTPRTAVEADIHEMVPPSRVSLEESSPSAKVSPLLDSSVAAESTKPVVPALPKIHEVKYTVQQGDTLAKIAKRFGTSVENLVGWNSLSTDVIFPGQQLIVTAESTVGDDSNP
jgi:LysM repeat protein